MDTVESWSFMLHGPGKFGKSSYVGVHRLMNQIVGQGWIGVGLSHLAQVCWSCWQHRCPSQSRPPSASPTCKTQTKLCYPDDPASDQPSAFMILEHCPTRIRTKQPALPCGLAPRLVARQRARIAQADSKLDNNKS